MLNIYLTRHGETLWNRENRLQGWKDSELTESGIRNAKALGKRLYQTSFHAIYSSPSARALQTAKLVCSGRNIPIIPDDCLKEIYFGDWEGKTREEIEEGHQQEFFHFWNAPQLYNHESHKGESLKGFKERVEQAVNRVIAEQSTGNILIVTHAVAIRAMLSLFMDIPVENWWKGPFIQGTSLTIIRTDGKSFQSELLGDTSHILPLS